MNGIFGSWPEIILLSNRIFDHQAVGLNTCKHGNIIQITDHILVFNHSGSL